MATNPYGKGTFEYLFYNMMTDFSNIVIANQNTVQSNLISSNNALSVKLNSINTMLDTVDAKITTLVDGGGTNLTDTIDALFNGVSDWLGESYNSMITTITTAYTNASSYFNSGYDALKQFLGETWSGITSFYDEYSQMFTDTVEGLKNDMINTTVYLGSQLGIAYDNMQTLSMGIWDSSKQFINDSIRGVQATIDAVLNDTTYFFTQLSEDLKSYLKDLLNFDPSKFNGIFGNILDMQKPIFERIMTQGLGK